MDHKDQHHEHHRKERELHKQKQKEYARQHEKKLLPLHPAWFWGLGVVLILLAIATWSFWLP